MSYDDEYDDESPSVQKPRYSEGTERSVLGMCLLGNRDFVQRVRDGLPDHDAFYNPIHAFIWTAIQLDYDDGLVPDPHTVLARMPSVYDRWDYRQAGMLVDLLGEAPIGRFATEHVALLVRWHQERQYQIAEIRWKQARAGGDIEQIKTATATYQEALAEIQAGTSEKRRPLWAKRFVDGYSFAMDGAVDPPPIWGRDDQVLWAPGESLMIVGPAGVGKSTLAAQIVAARIGLLDQALGYPMVATTSNVLYLAADRPRQVKKLLRRMLRTICGDDVGRMREALTRLKVWEGPPPKVFTDDTDMLRLMAELEQADTIVIDSLKDVAIGISEDKPAGLYNMARQTALANGIEIIELHHQVKNGQNGKRPTELSDVYGNQQITAGAGSVLLVWGEAGDTTVELSHIKQPQTPVGPLKVRHNHTTGISMVRFDPDPLTFIRHAGHPVTLDEVAQYMYEIDHPTRTHTSRAERALARLEDNGMLFRASNGQAPTWVLLNREEAPDDDDDGGDHGRYR